MEKPNGIGSQESHSRGSSHPVIPTIIITDYDAELAAQLQMNYDQQNQANCCSGSKSTPKAPESEEEDREIIESLTKAHSNNSNRHVDVDEASNLTQADAEMKKENNQSNLPSTSTGAVKKNRGLSHEKMQSMTDDDLADMEVSQLTSLLESKNTFSPLPGSTTQTFQRANARFLPMIPPLGMLPDISDLNLPRRVPAKMNPAFVDIHDTQRILGSGHVHFHEDLSTNRGLGSTTSEIANGNVSATFSGGSRFNRAECLPRNGGESHFGSRRTARLYGESDSDSQYSSSSSTVDVTSESSDDQPPQYWKLYDSNTTEKSDGGNKDDLNQILQTFQVINAVDDNASSTTSKGLTESSKQSKDDDKVDDDKDNQK